MTYFESLTNRCRSLEAIVKFRGWDHAVPRWGRLRELRVDGTPRNRGSVERWPAVAAVCDRRTPNAERRTSNLQCSMEEGHDSSLIDHNRLRQFIGSTECRPTVIVDSSP